MALGDNARGALYMNLSMATYTFNDTCVKAVTVHMSTFEAIFLRGLLTIAGLALLARRMGGLQLGVARENAVLITLRCLGEVASTVCFLTALKHIPLANISAILQSLPLAVTLGAAVFLGETIGWRRLVAIGIGFIGVTIIIRPGGAGFNDWSVLALAAVASVVLRDLVTRRLPSAVPSISVAFLAAMSVTALSAATMPFFGWVTPDTGQIVLIAGAAGFLMVGYMMAVMVMRVGEIGFVAPFRYTSLLWAILLGWLVFQQFPDTLTLTGSALVIATGIFTLWRERRRPGRGPAPIRIR